VIRENKLLFFKLCRFCLEIFIEFVHYALLWFILSHFGHKREPKFTPIRLDLSYKNENIDVEERN